jgi:hypothetical protein
MELGPGEHAPELSLAEVAVDHLDLVDSDLRAAVGVPGVEVGMAVVVEDIAIVIPKKRLIVGTPPIFAKGPVASPLVTQLRTKPGRRLCARGCGASRSDPMGHRKIWTGIWTGLSTG